MTAKTFFIGDTHFSHKNIIKFEPYYRPFDTIEEHDQELIRRWNSVVRPEDIVYHLGDVVFGKENFFKLGFLNGDKRLIMGNHDCYATKEYLRYFTKLYGCLQYNAFCILSHIPVNPMQLSKKYRYNIHGHLHSKNVKSIIKAAPDEAHPMTSWNKEINDPRYINVSCEQIDLTPISWEDIKKRYMKE